MTAMNIVRARVKPDQEDAFLELMRERSEPYDGQRSMKIVKTGDREYMFVGEWDSMDHIVAARPQMVETLDRLRDLLEDLGETGVTDPRSGDVVFAMP